MKKNNPGCNCCGDVLIWNLDNEVPCDYGRAERNGLSYVEPVNPRGPDNDNWRWFVFDELTFTLEDEGAKVDQCTRTDPLNWTEDIDDYKLIFWPQPNRGDGCDWPLNTCPPCGGTDAPEWWPKVKSGKWEGRIVIMWEPSFLVETIYEFGFADRPPFGGPATYIVDCDPVEDAIDKCQRFWFDQYELRQGWPGSLQDVCLVEPDPATPVLVPDRRNHRLMEDCDGVWISNGGSLFAPGDVVLEHQDLGVRQSQCTPNFPEPSPKFMIRETIVNDKQSRVVSGDSAPFTDKLEQVISGGENENRQFWRNLFNKPIRD